MEVRDRESLNGERLDKPGSSGIKQERPPSRSGSSSSRSTPSLKTKDVSAPYHTCYKELSLHTGQ